MNRGNSLKGLVDKSRGIVSLIVETLANINPRVAAEHRSSSAWKEGLVRVCRDTKCLSANKHTDQSKPLRLTRHVDRTKRNWVDYSDTSPTNALGSRLSCKKRRLRVSSLIWPEVLTVTGKNTTGSGGLRRKEGRNKTRGKQKNI